MKCLDIEKKGWGGTMLICPHCGAPLVRKDKTFCCESGHSYDIARAGYCNLLQTNKPGDHTGDSKEMVEARRRFLDQGYYEGLAMAMCQQMKNLTKDKADINFVDAGCGEGYYTRQMAAVLHENGKLKESIGVDISKSATQYAAKRDPHTQYVTGSAFHMPLEDHCADIICSLFAPTPEDEFLRVLKPDGVVVCAVPGEDHLWELKCAVYDKPYQNREEKYQLRGFRRIGRQKFTYRVHLECPEDIQTLFAMTPYSHRTPKIGLARLQALKELDVTLSFVILVFSAEETE